MAQITLNSSGVASNGSLLLQSNGTTTAVTIDTSQNVGLGVTPSAWTAGIKAIDIGNGSAIFNPGSSAQTWIYNNAYNNSGAKYKNSGLGASWYQMIEGAHAWYVAPSGTAGNAITFTQAMTLDANGALTVGNTSPFFATSNRGNISVNGSSSSIISLAVGAVGKGYLFHDGTNLSLANDVAGYLSFTTNASERARIDSSGNLLVGMTSGANGSLNVYKNTNVVFSGTAGNSASGYYLYAGYSDSSSTAFGTLRYYVLANGDVRNSNNSYGAISDVKLKENITDATPKLEQLNQVRIVNYNLIGDENKQLGVIAQELEQVFPSMVDESVDRDAEGNDLGTTTKSVKYSVFVPMLIKAIQEQQALITQLQADVAALKGTA